MKKEFKGKNKKKTPNQPRTLLCIVWVLFCGLAVCAVRMVMWVFNNWGNLKTDELIFTLTAPLTGTNPALIQSAITYVAYWGVAAVIFASCLLFYYHAKEKNMKILLRNGFIVFLAAILGSYAYFVHRIGFFGYVKNQVVESSFIEDHYADPDTVQLTFPKKKRNLIYLFVESMEISYADEKVGGGKSENLIPELSEIAQDNEDFSGKSKKLNGAYSLYGSTYTMGGLFAQTSGLPLTVPPSQIAGAKGFLPGITTLGDILYDHGYHNVFFIGTDASFGKRGTYYSQHGHHDIIDYNYAKENGEIPTDYGRAWWGYDDFILYENAKAHITELAQQDEPFNFTMLTVDSHAEDGYLCSLCPNEHPDDPYADVISCSSKQAAEFIQWVQEQDFYEDTTIVVVGDHITMDSDFCDDLDNTYQRKIYSTYINAAASPESKEKRELSSMDNFPTVLAALGVEIEGDKLGLGVNAFSDTPTMVEEFGKEELDDKLAQKSTFLEKALGEKDTHRKASVTYNKEENQFDIRVDKPLSYDGDFTEIICFVTNKKTKETMEFNLDETEEDYQAHVSLSNFNNAPGKYLISITLKLPDNTGNPYYEKNIKVK